MILELEKAQKENDQIKEELEKERKTAKELDAKEKQWVRSTSLVSNLLNLIEMVSR